MENQPRLIDTSTYEYDDLYSSVQEYEKHQRSHHREILRKMAKTIDHIKICDYVLQHNLETRFRKSPSKLNALNEELRTLTNEFEKNIQILAELNTEIEKRWN